MSQRRLPYDESIRRLRELGLLGQKDTPPIPDHVPQPEDEEPLGLSFFKTFVGEGADLSNLSLPRTFFGRSEIRNASFRNTDLTESNLRWNDFIDVDFSEATLVRADLRASIYTRVNFTRTDLRGADMRRADFEECVFDSALMDGVVLTRAHADRLALSNAQTAVIDWRNEDGPEPSGG
jgi:BTB/POZ domain-containing protein KCTD9